MKPKKRPNAGQQMRPFKGRRNRDLQARIRQLEEQLRASGTDSRKNMRERIARLAGEKKELEEKLKTAGDSAKIVEEQRQELAKLRRELEDLRRLTPPLS